MAPKDKGTWSPKEEGDTARACALGATVLQLGCAGSRNTPKIAPGSPRTRQSPAGPKAPCGAKALLLPGEHTAGEKPSAPLVAVTRALCALTRSKLPALGLAVPWARGDAQWFPSLPRGSRQTAPFTTREPIPGSCSRS